MTKKFALEPGVFDTDIQTRRHRHPIYRQRMLKISRDQVPARLQLLLHLFLAGNSNLCFKKSKFQSTLLSNKGHLKSINSIKYYVISSFNHQRASSKPFFKYIFFQNDIKKQITR